MRAIALAIIISANELTHAVRGTEPSQLNSNIMTFLIIMFFVFVIFGV